MYRALKTHVAKNQDSVPCQHFEGLYKIFTTIGSKLSEALTKSEYKCFTPTFGKTMVLTTTDENEVYMLRKELKNKKVFAMK